jgi:hypothetical protein
VLEKSKCALGYGSLNSSQLFGDLFGCLFLLEDKYVSTGAFMIGNFSGETCAVDHNRMADGRDAALPKAEFIEPKLICHGDLVDLTAQFGGSITPH